MLEKYIVDFILQVLSGVVVSCIVEKWIDKK